MIKIKLKTKEYAPSILVGKKFHLRGETEESWWIYTGYNVAENIVYYDWYDGECSQAHGNLDLYSYLNGEYIQIYD